MKKILVISPSWIGDSVMAQPLYRRLRERYPSAELHVFAPSWTLPLLSRMPEVSQAHLNPFAHGKLQLFLRWKIAKNLAQQHFDQAIVLPNSLKSALIPLFAGIPKRTGFVGEARYGLLNDIRVLDENTLPTMVERFSSLSEDPPLTRLDIIPHPRLTVDRLSQTQIIKQFGLKTDSPIAAFFPGAEYGPAKRWPTHHFAELAKRFSLAGFIVWLFGSPKDQTLGEEIVTLSDHCAINLCGKTRLDEAIDLIGKVDIAICNDSGLMHVAAALGKPLVAIYGSSSPDFTPPLSDQKTIVTLNLDCSPCFERVCPYGHTRCLQTLEPDRVWRSATQLLETQVAVAI